MMAGERGPLRVVGRYALYNEIAAGGMATVHIGRLLGPVGFARTVAIKRLHPQFAKDPEFVTMFLDEARLAARVQHPNVVATIDVVASDGELFLIMDYVRGESLSKLVRVAKKAGVRCPPRIAVSIVCGLLHGLHAAHEAKNERGDRINLVHRDVSPQNVLVGADGIARVLDFGIAKAAGRVQVTRDGQIKGKLAYMPPEQLSGREVTRAVDIFASAVVLWEALTGERLFKGETDTETLTRILHDDIPPPSAVVPALTPAFDATLAKALSRDPKQRHATARELAFDLEKCINIASASEVGEWVEQMAGPVLTAREDELAQIESHSAQLQVSPSGHPAWDGTTTDTPSARDGTVAGAGPREGTLVGVGPQSSGAVAAAGSASGRQVAAPVSGAAAAPRGARVTDESTGSRITGTRSTASMTLPLDRKLPLLATALGLLVLLVIVGVVLRGREAASGSAAEGSPSASVRALAAVSATTTVASGEATIAPAPPLAASSDGAPTGTEKPPSVGSAGATPVSVTTPAVRASASAHPPTRATAPGATTKPAAAPARKDCDPPYTVDANGRKKYKLECM
jgi:serine/threonine-protein kinase